MKKVVIILALVITSSTTFAQDAPASEAPASKFTAAVDVVYPYLWRGIALNATDKIAFQPYASYAFTDKFTFGVWGSTNLSKDDNTNSKSYNEFDWYASYQVSPIVKLMISDYYFDYPTVRGSYFNFDKTSTQAIDFTIALNFADKGVPLDFQINTLVAGNDFVNDKRNFSSYAEAGYLLSLKDAGIDFRPFVGAVLGKSVYYVTDKLKFTNVGLNVSKSIKISENYSIPLFVRYTYNENGNKNKNGELKTSFISGGATFKIF